MHTARPPRARASALAHAGRRTAAPLASARAALRVARAARAFAHSLCCRLLSELWLRLERAARRETRSLARPTDPRRPDCAGGARPPGVSPINSKYE